MTTPIEFPTSPPDDGDFSHPAFNDRAATNHDILGMAKALYDDAGLEWPEWVEDPSEVENKDGGNDENSTNTTTTDPGTQTPSADPPSTVVKIGDREIPIQQGEALLQWQDWLANNPDKAQTIINVLRGESPIPAPPTMVDRTPQQQQQQQQQQSTTDPVSTSTPPIIKPPDGFDLDTPRDKFILDQLNRLAENTTRLTALSDQQMQALRNAEMAQRAREDTAQAISTFKTKHKLSDDEVDQVRQIASDLNLVGGLVAKNPANAPGQIVKALEAAMWQDESIRSKLLNTSPPQPTNTDKSRQQKLNALSGSTGSTPRTEARPRLDTDHDMKDAIARAIESIAGSS